MAIPPKTTTLDEVIPPGEVIPRTDVADVSQESEYTLPNWTTGTHVTTRSFEKVGRIAMCADGLEIHSDLDERGYILLNEDIDAGT